MIKNNDSLNKTRRKVVIFKFEFLNIYSCLKNYKILSN